MKKKNERYQINPLNGDVSDSQLNIPKFFPIYAKHGVVIYHSNMYKHANQAHISKNH